MFTIGEFARLGGVSVRMLRHYDAQRLLVPARTDPHSGYRSYEAAQVGRLNRLVALKDLGFTLEQVRTILDDEVGADELRGMLRLRHAELTAQIADDRGRLDRVERRLRTIEKESHMTQHDITITSAPALRLAERSGLAESIEDVGPVVRSLYPQLAEALVHAGIPLQDAAVAAYELSDEGPIQVHAAFPVGDDVVSTDGFDVFTLSPVPEVAQLIHLGALDTIGDSWQALGAWIEREGRSPSGEPVREVYLDMPMDDPSRWVTALQWPLQPD
jgi:DNA-binding transcriptional MerR regulator/effector-binding domain-containing protein